MVCCCHAFIDIFVRIDLSVYISLIISIYHFNLFIFYLPQLGDSYLSKMYVKNWTCDSEFELAYYEAAVQHFSHYTPWRLRSLFISIYLLIFYLRPTNSKPGTVILWFLSLEIDKGIRFQIYISHSANTRGKWIHPAILPTGMGK